VAFKIHKCKGRAGLPLVEVPVQGPIAERLSPGEIREADFYGLFRRKGNLLVACPRDKVMGDRCSVPLRVLRIWHDRKDLPRILNDCRSGALSSRRRRAVDQILKDVRERGGPALGTLPQAARSVLAVMGNVGLAVMAVLFMVRILGIA